MMKKIMLCLCLLLSALCGCINVSQPYPEKQHFIVKAQRSGKILKAVPGSILKVDEFKISPAFAGQAIVYLMGENRYTADFYNEFFISTASMITEGSREWLEDSGLFTRVITEGSLLEPNFVLEGAIKALYGDFRNDNKLLAVVKMQFLLLQLTDIGTQIVYYGNYRQEITIKDDSAEELVKGMNQALTKILKSLENKLEKALKKE